MIAYLDSHGKLHDSREKVNEAEDYYKSLAKIEAVYDLIRDGGDMSWRFMNGWSCAQWIVDNEAKLTKILTPPNVYTK